jgi:hypothetical protein
LSFAYANLFNYEVQCPGSGAFLTPGSGIRDGKKSGSEIQEEYPRSLETVFWVKNLFDPGSGILDEKILIWDKHPTSATLN